LIEPHSSKASVTLEELHGALVLFGCGSTPKGAEVPPSAGSWIGLS
jgi:hypothetical protein